MNFQTKLLGKVKEMIEAAGLQFIHEPQYANTGTVRAQEKDGFKSVIGFCYNFQSSYATIQVYPGDKPIKATCGFTDPTCIDDAYIKPENEVEIIGFLGRLNAKLRAGRPSPKPPKKPKAKKPTLTAGYVANFETMKKAMENKDLALFSAVRKKDQKTVALVCAMERDEGMMRPVPLAVLCEGNPFEDFEDPTAV